MMKTYVSCLLKALGLTVGLNGALLLFLYMGSPLAGYEIGQVILFAGVTILLIIATCLYATMRVHNASDHWVSMAVSLPAHLIAAVVSVLIYGNRLSSFWPGGVDLAWFLFLVLIVAVWGLTVFFVTLVRVLRLQATAREEKRQAKLAKEGYRLETTPITPARARLLATLKGMVWALAFHLISGLLLELLREIGIAETILSYAAFPFAWCLAAAAYGLLDRRNRVAFALAVALTHLLFCTAVMLFLLPANVTQHVGYALLYLDKVLTKPYENAEQLLILIQFLSVWLIMLIFGIGHRNKKKHPSNPPADTDILFVEQEEE